MALSITRLEQELVNKTEPDLTFKIILIGNSGVGKSCLSLNGTTGKFEESYIATVGFDFFNYLAKVTDEELNSTKIIRLQIWDTCGQEGYRSLIQNFYRNCGLAIIVYSIDEQETFDSVDTWIKQLKTYANPDVKVFLIGNKSDLEDKRVISKSDGQKLQEDYKLELFMETSAKTGVNSEELFKKALQSLYNDYKKYGKDMLNTKQGEKLVINETGFQEKKNKACC